LAGHAYVGSPAFGVGGIGHMSLSSLLSCYVTFANWKHLVFLFPKCGSRKRQTNDEKGEAHYFFMV